MSYEPPTLLSRMHSTDSFRSRSDEQTLWLRRHASQAAAAGTAKVLVVTATGAREVVAYYAWAMAQIRLENAPARLMKGAGRYPQPAALLARLAVDERHEGKGLGAALLLDVMKRLAAMSDKIGCRALLVHSESEEARSFYLHLIPEFLQSPTNPMHLVLLLKDIKKTLAR